MHAKRMRYKLWGYDEWSEGLVEITKVGLSGEICRGQAQRGAVSVQDGVPALEPSDRVDLRMVGQARFLPPPGGVSRVSPEDQMDQSAIRANLLTLRSRGVLLLHSSPIFHAHFSQMFDLSARPTNRTQLPGKMARAAEPALGRRNVMEN